MLLNTDAQFVKKSNVMALSGMGGALMKMVKLLWMP